MTEHPEAIRKELPARSTMPQNEFKRSAQAQQAHCGCIKVGIGNS